MEIILNFRDSNLNLTIYNYTLSLSPLTFDYINKSWGFQAPFSGRVNPICLIHSFILIIHVVKLSIIHIKISGRFSSINSKGQPKVELIKLDNFIVPSKITPEISGI